MRKPDPFFKSRAWLELRYSVLKRSRGRCEACGARPSDVNPLHVDHIQPRSTHKHLELAEGNLQVLCANCNLGKSNIDDTDWRHVVSVDPRVEQGIKLTPQEEAVRQDILSRAINGSTEEERQSASSLYQSITKFEWGMFKEVSATGEPV